MTTLLQVSDAHFGTERPGVVRALIGLVAQQRPDLLVFSGDVTQRARRRQFEGARRFLNAVRPARAIAIPGNHDIPLFNLYARLVDPYGGHARVFGADLEPTVDEPDALVVAVNTTRWYRHKHGEISGEQVERVVARLRQARKEQVRIVVVHQPVLVIREEDRKNAVRGRDRAVPAWVEAGADLILGGHIHLPYARSLRSAYPGLTRDAWTAQAGTALSTRVRAGISNSVNLVRCAPGTDGAPRRATVERWDYDEGAAQFGLHDRHDLAFE